MKKLIIKGGNKLSGTIKIGGAKNSVVALLPAAVLSKGKCKIYNVPNISDVKKLKEMLSVCPRGKDLLGSFRLRKD